VARWWFWRVELRSDDERIIMKRFNQLLAGGLLGASLLTGVIAGTAGSAGAATLIPLLPTVTTVVATQAPQVGEGRPPVVISSSTQLAVIGGLLITPSGSVTFTAVNGPTRVPLGSTVNGSCLLKLSPLLGSCTSTLVLNPTLTQLLDDCGGWTIVAYYSGSTDLVAQPSTGSAFFHNSECES
jgi:hypothetical protein